MVAILMFILGTINAAGIDMRESLAALSPQGIERALLGQSVIVACTLYLGVMTVSGLLGGLFVHSIKGSNLRLSITQRWDQMKNIFSQLPLVKQAQRNPNMRFVFYGILLLVVFLMPLSLGSYWNYNMGTVGIYVLLGLGLNIVVGMAGLLDLGYVAFFAIGAYTVSLLTAPLPHKLMWDFWLVLPIAVAMAALSGILLGVPVLRMRGDYLAIVTLGFGEIIRILIKSDAMTPLTGGPRGVRAVGQPTLFGRPFNDERSFMYLIIIAILFAIYITWRLQNSHVGRAWIAMREDETVAKAAGINTLKFKLLAFAIGAAFAGLGGVLFASRNQFTGPEDHTLMVSINVLCLVIVGGMGSIPGVILGAFTLKGLPELMRQLEDYRMLAFGALLVVMMILRPEGLWPSRQRRLEMRENGDGNAEVEEGDSNNLEAGGQKG
jgi:branched-chain amino acid transport system permease protein